MANPMCYSPITIYETQKAIRKLKCKQATGIDGIPTEVYKHGFNELLPALVLLHSFISVICPCVDTANLRLSLG